MKYITYTTVRLKCLSPPKRIHPGTCAVSPRALPKGWRAVGPRPHASLSNPDESPHCPVHTAGFLPFGEDRGGQHPRPPWCSLRGKTPPLEVTDKAPSSRLRPQTGSAFSRKACQTAAGSAAERSSGCIWKLKVKAPRRSRGGREAGGWRVTRPGPEPGRQEGFWIWNSDQARARRRQRGAASLL